MSNERRYLYLVIFPNGEKTTKAACDRNHAIELSIGSYNGSRKSIKTKRLW